MTTTDTFEPVSGQLVLLRWDPSNTRIARFVRWNRNGKAVVQVEMVDARGGRVKGRFGADRTFDREHVLGPAGEDPSLGGGVAIPGRAEWGFLKRLDDDVPIRAATQTEWKRSVVGADRDPDGGGAITVQIDGSDVRCYVDGGDHPESEAYR